MENQNDENQSQIEFREDIAQGDYANLAIITHSSSEFILDFIRVMPGLPKASLRSRVILAPEHAKRLLRILEDNIRKYEHSYTKIHLENDEDIAPIVNIKGDA